MATISTSTKRPRASKSVQQEYGSFAPLIVDTSGVELLRIEPVASEVYAKKPALERRYDIVYELKSPSGKQGDLVFVVHTHKESKRTHSTVAKDPVFDSKRAVAEGLFHPWRNDANDELLRSLIEETLTSFKEVQGRHTGVPSVDEVLREVGETLRDKASTSVESTEEGWQALLERGLRSKTALLVSSQFKSTKQASELLGVGEPAIRKRIREQKLFALRSPGDGEHRIPAWALDPEIAGKTTAALYAGAAGMDEWQLYHFLSTPRGQLNGLRPFECLMSRENLPHAQRSARHELLEHLAFKPNASLLDTVQKALLLEMKEGRPA